MKLFIKKILICLFLVSFIFPSLSLGDENSFLIGMVNDLSGPKASLGQGMKMGSRAYFNKVNAEGGIHGQRIKVISYDDQSLPEKTLELTEILINKDKVSLLFGYVGTTNILNIEFLLNEKKIPLLFSLSSSHFLREPLHPYIFMLTPSYFDETKALVEYLVKKKSKKNMGVFVQEDIYGRAGKAAFRSLLYQKGIALKSIGRYGQYTSDLTAEVARLRKENLQVLAFYAKENLNHTFMEKAKFYKFKPLFVQTSLITPDQPPRVFDKSFGELIFTQTVPILSQSKEPLVKEYFVDMAKAGYPPLSNSSFQGYIGAMILVHALTLNRPPFSNEKFIQILEGLNSKIEGFEVSFSKDDHQALDKIYFGRIKKGKLKKLKL